MKHKLQSIWRVLLANEYVVITPFGLNSSTFVDSTSHIANIANRFEEIRKQNEEADRKDRS
jgi:hypothetical protein